MNYIIMVLGLTMATFGLKESLEASETPNVKQHEIIETVKDTRALGSDDIITISAEDWLCSYADNADFPEKQEKMKDEWKNKLINLKGEVYTVHNDSTDGYRITIKQKRSGSNSDGWCMITCYFSSESDIEKLDDIKTGDNVSIIGFSKWDLGPTLIGSHIC